MGLSVDWARSLRPCAERGCAKMHDTSGARHYGAPRPEMEVPVLAGLNSWTRSLLAFVPFVIACSGSQQNPDTPADGSTSTWKDPTDDTKWSDKPSPDTSGGSGSSGSSESGGLNSTQREQMEIVLKRGTKKAENCSESVPDGKGGAGEVKVLFDGQKGRITEVTVGGPWAGTSMEACIKRAFVGEIIVPFEGDPLEVPYEIKIPEKKGGAPAADPKKPGKK